MIQEVRKYYENTYRNIGINAQRKWPNEEFCRFMGRNFFNKKESERKNIKILEAGCGTGSNLRLLASEGFDVYGIELSQEAINMVPFLLNKQEIKQCEIVCGNMMDLPWDDGYFDAIVDIFSSYCLDEKDFGVFVDEVYNKLLKGGKYFSYTPSKDSDAFLNYKPAKKLDESTLDGIKRETSPYYGNFYPFRFMGLEDVKSFFAKDKFELNYIEKISRTYNSMYEKFDFIVFEATKI
jgi:Methylase involved in ubiquinone/menaquinone biosynthesis